MGIPNIENIDNGGTQLCSTGTGGGGGGVEVGGGGGGVQRCTVLHLGEFNLIGLDTGDTLLIHVTTLRDTTLQVSNSGWVSPLTRTDPREAMHKHSLN